VQICKEDLTLAEHFTLNRLGFFHLHDHVGGGKDFGGCARDFGPCCNVVFVGETSANAALRFYRHGVTCVHRFAGCVRCDPNAEFLWFDLFWATDVHDVFPP